MLGIASTIHGFAYSLTEGPGCLVKVGHRKTPSRGPKLDAAIDSVVLQSRPLFVAVEHMSGMKQERFHQFSDALSDCCETHSIKLVTVGRNEIAGLTNIAKANKWDVACKMAEEFPEIAYRLPKKRVAWKSEDERFGIFTALAAAKCLWRRFSSRPVNAVEKPISSSEHPPDGA